MAFNDEVSSRTAGRKRWRWIVLLLVALAVSPVVIHFAKPRKPVGNTKEYLAAHGVVEGRVNELRVKGVLFRFPATYRLELDTGGDIVRGQADVVRLYQNMSFLFGSKAGTPGHIYGDVRIDLRADSHEDVGREWARLAASNWESMRERPNLGMIEYTERDGSGGLGRIAYATPDPHWRTPKGGPIVFSCFGPAGQESTPCWTGYQHPRGPYVEYHLPSDLLPYWREVHNEVIRLVDSFILPPPPAQRVPAQAAHVR
jgi:hypothetical protein